MTKSKKIAGCALVLLLCAAVTQSLVWAEESAPTATAPAAQTPTTGPASETAVTVNGKIVTEADLDEAVVAYTQNRQLQPGQLQMIKQRYRAQILRVLIDEKLFEAQADKENVTVTDQEVAERIEKDLQDYARNNGLSQEELDKQVQERMGMNLKDYVAQRAAEPFLKRMLRRTKLIEKRFPEAIQVTDADVQAEFDKSAKVRASHILIDTRNKTEEEKAAARKRAEEILAEAKKPGADFAELAAKNSDCPSKARGGDLGFFAREGAMVEPFAKAAYELKEGEISDIVETQFGYHIIKVTDVKTFDESSAELRELARRQKINDQMEKYSEELRKDAKIVYPEGKEPTAQPMGLQMVKPAPRPSTRPAAQ
ncbi:MAG TPA: peptidylprolyl isomerase [Phycisphaerae bacterium]|nr:peptidylprolyl isomerase [Phycisphaerae bacterium]HOJ72448.1 peptidylprolyl isomerase [Phycisphaerae bacterium]HOM49890.1 peptidylprolyl isomerase [Phycisphaerae bacterium]HON67681.1 peptidylprolyl isomerase [Phycisphaerae bacterium]HOQ84696.1 peptidylprolyl isomerase [Phycisphaerae bacterium]